MTGPGAAGRSTEQEGKGTTRSQATLGVIAAALGTLALGISLLLPPARAVPSTYDTGPDGMAALYQVLRRLGLPSARWTAAGWPPRGTLMIAALGRTAPTRAQAAGLRQWVRQGGRVVLLGVSPSLAQAFGVVPLALPGPLLGLPTTARAALPLPLLRGAGTVAMPAAVGLGPVTATLRAVPLYVAPGGVPVALLVRVGKGRLVWVGSPLVWSNRVLATHPANLRLAFTVLTTLRRRGEQVWFDEGLFGATLLRAQPPAPPRRPGRPLPLPAGLPWMALGLGSAAALGLWEAGWRRVPVRPPTPLSPPDLSLQAYARLLQRQGAVGRRRRAGHG